MTLKQPASMDECVYFTNRAFGQGKIKAWAFKENCPKCKQGLMGKPKDPKTGRPKIRSQEYVCPKCNHTVQKKEYEDTLTVNIQYTCPHCSHSDELQIPFKRKKVKIKGIIDKETGESKDKKADSLRFQCSKCGENIDITKKMKGQ